MESAHAQKSYYDTHSKVTRFAKGDLNWISILTAGKLSPQWEGGWKIDEVKSPVMMKIANGQHSKVVHVNCLRHKVQLEPGEGNVSSKTIPWSPPEIEHSIISMDTPKRRYPA